MAEVIGVRFRAGGKIYYFDSGDISLEVNDYVVTETASGVDLGRVVIPPGKLGGEHIDRPLKLIARKAQSEDIDQARELSEKEANALDLCRELAADLKLPLKPVAAHYHLDGNLTIHFTAPRRVDFRFEANHIQKPRQVRSAGGALHHAAPPWPQAVAGTGCSPFRCVATDRTGRGIADLQDAPDT